MARQSKVIIQGVNVPGGRMEVIVPVDHTYACEVARKQYGIDGQYIWSGSWDTDQPSSQPARSGGSSSGGGIGGMLFLFLAGAVVVGALGGGEGSKPNPSSFPESAPVERTLRVQPSYANPAGPCVTDNFEPC